MKEAENVGKPKTRAAIHGGIIFIIYYFTQSPKKKQRKIKKIINDQAVTKSKSLNSRQTQKIHNSECTF